MNLFFLEIILKSVYSENTHPQKNRYFFHTHNFVTFISRLKALDYTKLRSQNLHCIKSLKYIKLKITPTFFGSYSFHHQGVQSCTSLKFVEVHLCLSCAWLVFGSVILNQWCVCVRYDGLGSPSYRTHTPLVQNYAAKHRPSTRQTSVNLYEFQSSTALYSLMMDQIRPETWRSDF